MKNSYAFHKMAKSTGLICNLDCTYCFFFLKKLYRSNKDWKVRERVLESYIRQYIDVQKTYEITSTWKPTFLGGDYFNRLVEL